MSLSHSQLRRWYTAYNKKWFNSRLPEEMDVLYAPSDDAHGLATCDHQGHRTIEIDTAIAGTRFAKGTLLHEMVHHDTSDWSHGERFQNGMKRLALMGAFKNIW